MMSSATFLSSFLTLPEESPGELATVPLEKRGTLLLVVGGVVSPVHRRDEVEKGRKEVSEREGLKDDGGNTERE
jgi:hypothetical protein